jgi:hypothetical protein
MQIPDYCNHFSVFENEWLSKNKIIQKELFEEIEDISNVNPLDNGEADLRPLKIAIKATKLIIQVSQKNMIEGPYNTMHFQLIQASFPQINFPEKYFWQYFSFECACKRDEDINDKHRIYLAALTNIILSDTIEDAHLNDFNLGVFNMNTNKIDFFKTEGVNTRFI